MLNIVKTVLIQVTKTLTLFFFDFFLNEDNLNVRL